MKGIVITTASEIKEMEFVEPLDKSLDKVVGGEFRRLYARGLEKPYFMVVNGDACIEDLPVNPIGRYLYNANKTSYSIVGDIVIMKDGFTEGEPDIVGLTEEDIQELALILDDVQQELGM